MASGLSAFDITRNGEISLLYTNGQSKLLKDYIAVALFTNPSYLEFVADHLYSPTDKSGLPMIHRVNSQNIILR